MSYLPSEVTRKFADADEVQVARIKLNQIRKLRTRQKQLIKQAWADYEATEPSDTVKRIQILYTVLKTQTDDEDTSLFNVPVGELRGFFEQAKIEQISPELLNGLLKAFKTKMKQCDIKSEAMYLYVTLLDDFLTGESSAAKGSCQFSEEEQSRRADAVKLAQSALKRTEERDNAASVDFGFVDEIIGKLDQPAFSNLKRAISGVAEKKMTKKVSDNELNAAIETVIKEKQVESSMVERLGAIKKDSQLATEYCGLLTLLVQGFAEWECPPEGFPMCLQLFDRPDGRRWRALVRPDIFNLLFLHIVGTRWMAETKVKLQKLYDSACVIPGMEMHRSAYGVHVSKTCPEKGEDSYPEFEYTLESEQCLCGLASFTGETSRWAYGRDSSNGNSPAVDQFRSLAVVVARHKGVSPVGCPLSAKPLTVVCADIENLSHSLSQKLILYIAEKFGFPVQWVQFFERFMGMKVYSSPSASVFGIEGAKSIEGVAAGFALSRYLAELVLFMLDLHVRQQTDIRFCRYHDDFMFWHSEISKAATAWRVMSEGVKRLGLKWSEKKCGCTTISPAGFKVDDTDDAMSQLPSGRPFRWRLLDLQNDGQWTVSAERYSKFKRIVIDNLESTNSVFSMIQAYNTATWKLAEFLGPASPALGESHWRRVVLATFSDLHRKTFSSSASSGSGEDCGILARLRKDISRKCDVNPEAFVEAWFYWPLTAGGMSLENPILQAMPMLFALQESESWMNKELQKTRNHYYNFWDALLRQPVEEASPKQDALTKRWAKQFDQRRKELFGDSESEARNYWMWMISSYGEQIQNSFGSFNFLNKELVSIILVRCIRSLAG